MQRFLSCGIMVSVILSLAFTEELFSLAKPNDGSDQNLERKVELESYYLEHPWEDAHQIRIVAHIAEEKSSGWITLDKNSCSLDDYGNTHLCTAANSGRSPVELEEVATETHPPRSPRSPRIYIVERSNHLDLMKLIVPPEPDGDYRLVCRMNDGRDRVIPLRIKQVIVIH